MTADGDKDEEQGEHSFIAGENKNIYGHVEIKMVISQKISN